ncbi:response regulator [Aquicoccus sp. SCR17]|nr:response regulator [Carideicomes alvinocaridis]
MELVAKTSQEELNPWRAEGHVAALIVDDSEFDRRRIRRLSVETALHIDLDEADSIRALPDRLEAADFDVILLDYALPEGDGLEALEMVRRSARNAGCPVIMVAGGDQPSVAVRALKEGCSDYLTKHELNAQRLKNAILRVMEAGRSSRERVGDMRNAMHRAMDDHARALQPELARIVRDLRQLRLAAGEQDAEFLAQLDAVERRCLGLWTLLRVPIRRGTRPS